MPIKEYKVRAKNNYRKKTKQIAIEFNVETEQELLEYVQAKDNKQRYIKDLIRADMERASE